MPAQEIPSEFKCGRCKLDMRIEAKSGGCKCSRSHDESGGKVPKAFVDYDAYDGYGSFDYVRYLLDR